MQGQAIAFAVQNNGLETIRAKRMSGLNDFPAVRFNGSNGLLKASLDVEIEHRTMIGWLFVVFCNETASHLTLLMGMQAERGHSRKFFSLHGSAKNGGIESNSPVKVKNRNIEPDNLISHCFTCKRTEFLFIEPPQVPDQVRKSRRAAQGNPPSERLRQRDRSTGAGL
jgi:hypothetical protein